MWLISLTSSHRVPRRSSRRHACSNVVYCSWWLARTQSQTRERERDRSAVRGRRTPASPLLHLDGCYEFNPMCLFFFINYECVRVKCVMTWNVLKVSWFYLQAGGDGRRSAVARLLKPENSAFKEWISHLQCGTLLTIICIYIYFKYGHSTYVHVLHFWICLS